MFHLLKIEWLKIKNYKAFWVFAILYLVSIFLINYIGYYIELRTRTEVPATGMILDPIFAYPRIWQTVAWMSSWLLYFPGMVLIMLMVNEFNFKTHRQNIIDGWSRHQFISVKIAMAVIFALVITLLNFLTAVFFGSVMASQPFASEGIENMGYVFLQALAYMFFALMLAVLFRRSGLAIIVFFLYGLIFEWLLTAVMVYELGWTPFGYFLPLQTSDVLIPAPFADGIFYPEAPPLWALLVMMAVYISLYWFFARKKFVVDDL
jgi:ABC-2 type transport system permease protein